jgi:DNA-binding NtrC family response regulator
MQTTPVMMESRCILVVDDDRAMREMLVDQLRDDGYEAVSAAGVREARALLVSRPFAAVLSDIHMGPENGFSLVEEVRRLPQPVPVILMSSFGSRDTADRALKAGAVAFLGKPFDGEALLAALESCMEVSQAEEGAERGRGGEEGDVRPWPGSKR